MKAIILAAGYATRLYPLTQNFPKPLLEINKKPMIDYVIDKIEEIGIKDIYVVTNNKFSDIFKKWAEKKKGKSQITIVNDMTNSNEDRLGALGDIKYTIEKCKINDDLLIIGGDNLFKFSLKNAYSLFLKNKENTTIAYDVKDFELIKKYSALEIDKNSRVISFEEKPQNPKSTLTGICVYFYPKKTIKLLYKFLNEGNNADNSGNLVAWLVKNYTVYAVKETQKWYDVGSFEILKKAKEEFGEKNVDIEKLKRGIL